MIVSEINTCGNEVTREELHRDGQLELMGEFAEMLFAWSKLQDCSAFRIADNLEEAVARKSMLTETSQGSKLWKADGNSTPAESHDIDGRLTVDQLVSQTERVFHSLEARL